jgi:hypothetical protein
MDQAERMGKSIVSASRKEWEVPLQCVRSGRSAVEDVSV